jgi:hypothetical protein
MSLATSNDAIEALTEMQSLTMSMSDIVESESIMADVEYNLELDIAHRNTFITPDDTYSTWYYQMLRMYRVEKLLMSDIVSKLNDMYPWYRAQSRTNKSKHVELSRILRDEDNGVNYRTSRAIKKVTDEEIIAALKDLSQRQQRHGRKILSGDWDKFMTKPINSDTFKRRLGNIVRKKCKDSRNELMSYVKTIHGPWRVPAWKWHFDSLKPPKCDFCDPCDICDDNE